MPLSLFRTDHTLLPPFIQRIGDLYSAMDRAYAEAALHYGFDCKGCERNCCEERFFHYTIAEQAFLAKGLDSLDSAGKDILFRRADEAMHQYGLRDAAYCERVPCPLSRDGHCVLYAYRPMICRLQGIPHSVRRAGQPPRKGPGCHVFHENVRTENLTDFVFDHTPFYAEMASIEREIRNRLNYRERRRKTVAEMLIDIRDQENQDS